MDEVEAVGFAMWKAEADRAAPNVGKNRAIENYRYDLDPTSRAKWDQIAQAAIAALDAARGDAEPVAWRYVRKPEEWPPANPVVQSTRWLPDDPARPFWIEQPLYAHPPRGDQVARVVEWLRKRHPTQHNGIVQKIREDIAAEIERGEPFNG